MSFCESCGKPLHEGALFCGACGAKVPEDEVQPEMVEEEAPPEPTAWSCVGCGADNGAEALYCSKCGARHFVVEPPVPEATVAPTAVMAGVAAAADGGAAADASRGGVSKALHTPWILAVVICLVVAAIAAAVVLVVVQRGNDVQAGASFETQSQAIVAPLAPIVTSVASGLPTAVVRCSWSTKLDPAVHSAQDLRTALTQAQTDFAALESQTDAQAATKKSLGEALTTLSAYADAVSALPTQLSKVTPAEAESLRRAATAAQTACGQLKTAAPGLPALAVPACASIPAGARKARNDSVLRVFLMKVQNDILNQSQYGRSDIVSAVAGVQGMTLNPNDAAITIESVQSNRQSLLDQLSAMTVPDDTRAGKVYDLLQQSLQHSIEADRYYAAWMHHVYEYYYAEPEGYMGSVPHEDNYDSAVSQSSMAGSAKSNFCRLYNPLAKRFDLRHDWQEGQL